MNKNTNEAIFDPVSVPLMDSNLIEASAGTGKTYSIAILALRLILEKGIPVQQILMVTFTKAAVAELETRIRQFVRAALKVSHGATIRDETITQIVKASMADQATGPRETQRLLKEAVLFLDETAILTIHGFCQRVLSEFAFETGQVFGSEILTDLKSVLSAGVNIFWRSYITTLYTPLLKELVLAGLNRNSLVEVLKQASSGKEIYLLENIPEDFLSPENQLRLEESVREVTGLIENVRSALLAFISANLPAITSATEKNTYTKKSLLPLLPDPEAFLEGVVSCRDKGYALKLYPEIIARIEEMIRLQDNKKRIVNIIISHIHCKAIEIVTQETIRYKARYNQLSFDDMINRIHAAVVKDNNTFLIHSLRAKFQAAFIDEFQDTDKIQYEIFDRLFSTGTILFYIGDPKQAIYSFRKADIFTYFKAAGKVSHRYGMNVNYRSSARFIKAMNQVFVPVQGFDTFCFGGNSNDFGYQDVFAPADSTRGELCHNGKTDMPISIYECANNNSISETVVSQIIQLLGVGDYTIVEKGVSRKLVPSDIGILVRTHSQSATIKKLLAKYGIPAVTIDEAKLLQSEESRYLLFFLEATLEVNASNINKALLSPLTGLDAAAILIMNDEYALERFKEYQQIWEKEGVYIMLSRFIADYRVKQQLLLRSAGNGQRILTNVLQLMEILHKVQTQKQFSPPELAHWLKRGIEGMEVEGDEYEQRVESDEIAVKIVTIHKSKGLEYNIVFAPFLDLVISNNHQFRSFRDEQQEEYLFSDTSLLNDEQLFIAQSQELQENRRLIYVAVTRAVYKCYILKNTHGKFKNSALAPFTDAIREARPSLIAFETSAYIPEDFTYKASSSQVAPVYVKADNFQLLEPNWRKMSYTWLDNSVHTPSARNNSLVHQDEYDDFVFKQLKRGAHTGNLLHAIFEKIDFANDAFWEKAVIAGLKKFMARPPEEYASRLLELLYHISEVPVNIAGSHFSLKDITKSRQISELEFDFLSRPFTPESINRLSTPGIPFQVRSSGELEGIINGKIDLFFEHAGKYYILDWKSNFLGDSIADYSISQIRQAMEESNYHLQYLLYTLAVKKYCEMRLDNFDYATQFGGVVYLFVRGIRKGSETGIFTCMPDEYLVVQMENLLSGTQLNRDS